MIRGEGFVERLCSQLACDFLNRLYEPDSTKFPGVIEHHLPTVAKTHQHTVVLVNLHVRRFNADIAAHA